MASYMQTAVEDEANIEHGQRNLVDVGVQEGDNVVDLTAADIEHSVTLRLTMEEALSVIECLSVAVRIALTNDAE